LSRGGNSQLKQVEGILYWLGFSDSRGLPTTSLRVNIIIAIDCTTTTSSALLDAMQYNNQPLSGNLGFFEGLSDLASQRCEKLQDPSYFNLALSM
jgi:hypothetical protein